MRRWASRRVNILFVVPTVSSSSSSSTASCPGRRSSPSPTRRPSPTFNFVGLQQYVSLWSNSRWHASVTNLAIFTVGFVGLSTLVGLLLAILLDQKVKAEGLVPHHLPLPARDLLHRHRHGVEMGAEPRPRHREADARLGLRELPVRLDRRPRPRHLHADHRGGLAGLGLRHGGVPRRAPRRRRGDRQGGEDRRRRA